MFFSGDPASRRRVELRGRSNKETDRQSTLNKAKDEREQRQRARQRQRSALQIQKYYRGRRVVALHRIRLRERFIACYGEDSSRAGRDVFKAESSFLPELFYFVSTNRPEGLPQLLGACRHFSHCLLEAGDDVLAVFVSSDYATQKFAVNYRVKTFAILCLRALHDQREHLKTELTLPKDNVVNFLVESILALTRLDLPWLDIVLKHLAQDKLFQWLRDLLLTVEPGNAHSGVLSSLGRLVHQLSLRTIQRASVLESLPFEGSLPVQIYSVPLLWQRIPLLKQLSVTEGVWAGVVCRAAKFIPLLRFSFPPDVGSQFPSAACFLGNMLEAARLAVLQPNFDMQLMTDFARVGMFVIGGIPSSCYISPGKADEEPDPDAMLVEDGNQDCHPDARLMAQLQHASSFDFLKNLVKVAFSQEPSKFSASDGSDAGVVAVCGFIYAAFFLLDSKTLLSGLAYSAGILPPLWRYIRFWESNQSWQAVELYTEDGHLTPRFLGWMLPLAVFCPVLSRLLYSLDNDEFYAMEHPLNTDDLTELVAVVREALWQLLCVMHRSFDTRPSVIFAFNNMRRFLIRVFSSLLGELYDRNSKRRFASPDVFYASQAREEDFIVEAGDPSTGASELLNSAPFLIPFTWRVRVYTARIAEARSHTPEARVRVRRERIFEDSFDQINLLPKAELHGAIRVSFVNEFGLDEAGVDGGGMFKDFMESINKAAFDIQYGLFKETADHLLYPNPASHLVHENHLSYFEFVGKILGKAMLEGILVDIPFAAFFLRKLRKKNNYLHDLPSLDPELYKNLLYLKNNADMLSQLGLYFVIEDSYFGEQREVELLPDGKDMQVTNENVFQYIHLVANHRLNNEIRPQSSHFLRGFQQVISPDWIAMFNEHELQVLISGSRDQLDIDDLRENARYSGGYHADHPVIQMLWEIIKMFDVDMQRKFLKFVTGCSRGPLLGFKYLEPLFCIQKTVTNEFGGEVLDRLPTAATCMNLLKLPPYESKESIREKLIYAITSGAGFDLS